MDRAPGPRTANAIRSHLRRVLRDGMANGVWVGPDPTLAVRQRRIIARSWPTLSRWEARWLIRCAPSPWQAIYSLAIGLGLRRGELVALRAGDVDLELGILHVRRSHERDTTKNGRARDLPLSPELVGLLSPIVPSDPGQLLFPAPGGQIWRRDAKWSRKLRHHLVSAGLVESWRSWCRACGSPPSWSLALPLGPCNRCGRSIWSQPQPKPLRWYDLRHTFSRIAFESGVPREIRAAILGHIGDTTTHYERFPLELLRKELEPMHRRLFCKIPPPLKSGPPGAVTPGGPVGSPVEEKPERETRFELATLSLGTDRTPLRVEELTEGQGSQCCAVLEDPPRPPAVLEKNAVLGAMMGAVQEYQARQEERARPIESPTASMGELFPESERLHKEINANIEARKKERATSKTRRRNKKGSGGAR